MKNFHFGVTLGETGKASRGLLRSSRDHNCIVPGPGDVGDRIFGTR